MNKAEFGPIDISSINEIIQKIKNDPEVCQVIALNHQDMSIVDRNVTKFMEFMKDREKCRQCIGLFQCANEQKGIRNEIDFSYDVPYVVRKKCPYKAQLDKKIAHRKNYLYCDLSQQQLLIDINEFDLSKESREYNAIYQLAKRWLQQLPEKGIYFYGGFGTGKTYLAAAMANDLAKRGHKVAFVKVAQFAAQARNNFDGMEDIIYRLKKAEVLCLDDIGAEKLSEWVRDDLLFNILDYRMEHHKKTIFTSNSNMEALAIRMKYSSNGEVDETKAGRIMERIQSLSMEVSLPGTSRRR